jgi:tripartite-type tricarboxylate transporter receptor subunit TctC
MFFCTNTSGDREHTSRQTAGPRGNQRDALGIGTPKKTPVAIINTLNHQINTVLADPKVKERFADVGGTPLGGSPADFHKLITDEIAKWGKVIRTANINPE